MEIFNVINLPIIVKQTLDDFSRRKKDKVYYFDESYYFDGIKLLNEFLKQSNKLKMKEPLIETDEALYCGPNRSNRVTLRK